MKTIVITSQKGGSGKTAAARRNAFRSLAEGLADIAGLDAAYCFIDTAATISDQTARIRKAHEGSLFRAGIADR